MDIDLLRTFLEVSRTRHFGRAADNLFVTQSTVSARIRQLEESVGAPVFTRARNDIQLTPTGRRLVRHAEAIVNTWNRARQEVSVDEDTGWLLAVGGVPSLWDVLLQDSVHRLYRELPDMVLNTEVHGADALLRRLRDGSLDLGFMFEPPQTADLGFEQLANLRLVMVSSRPGLTGPEAVGRGYVLADWGESFALAHAKLFPDMPPPAVRMGLGRLALAFVLEFGGSAYLAESMVARELEAGRLFRVEGAPVIDRAAYTVYAVDTGRAEVLQRALSCLKGGR